MRGWFPRPTPKHVFPDNVPPSLRVDSGCRCYVGHKGGNWEAHRPQSTAKTCLHSRLALSIHHTAVEVPGGAGRVLQSMGTAPA